MKKLMEDKVVLVTGGGSGIGRAAALAFAGAGAKVAITGRREVEGHETVALIKKQGGQGLFIQGDVTNEAEVEQFVAQTVATYGRLDAAFNNAGIEGEVGKPTHEQSVANYRAVMDINVLGVLLAMKHEIAAMLKSGGGAIVNNASVGGVIGFPGVSGSECIRREQARGAGFDQNGSARIREARHPRQRGFARGHRDADAASFYRWSGHGFLQSTGGDAPGRALGPP
jgi:NAD(P)-dependent dehydrogenase (short-subunit alcohol dehydrogenase family)